MYHFIGENKDGKRMCQVFGKVFAKKKIVEKKQKESGGGGSDNR